MQSSAPAGFPGLPRNALLALGLGVVAGPGIRPGAGARPTTARIARRLRIAFKHGRQGDVQDFAYVEQARRTDAVDAPFIFLNLLKRDAQGFTNLLLAHAEREPPLAHPLGDVSVDRGCASWWRG